MPSRGKGTAVNLSQDGTCLLTGQTLEPRQILLSEAPQAGALDTEVVWAGEPDEKNLTRASIRRPGLAGAVGIRDAYSKYRRGWTGIGPQAD